MVERCGAKPVLVGCVWIEQFSAAASVLEPHPHSNPHGGGPEHSGVAPVGADEATEGIVAGVPARVTVAGRLTVGPASFFDH